MSHEASGVPCALFRSCLSSQVWKWAVQEASSSIDPNNKSLPTCDVWIRSPSHEYACGGNNSFGRGIRGDVVTGMPSPQCAPEDVRLPEVYGNFAGTHVVLFREPSLVSVPDRAHLNPFTNRRESLS